MNWREHAKKAEALVEVGVNAKQPDDRTEALMQAQVQATLAVMEYLVSFTGGKS